MLSTSPRQIGRVKEKFSVTLSDAVSTSVGCFAKRFERIHSPRRDESGFLFLFTESTYVC